MEGLGEVGRPVPDDDHELAGLFRLLIMRKPEGRRPSSSHGFGRFVAVEPPDPGRCAVYRWTEAGLEEVYTL